MLVLQNGDAPDFLKVVRRQASPQPSSTLHSLCHTPVTLSLLLRTLPQRFRCLERTRVSSANKAQLVVMAENVMRVVGSLVCCDERRHLRAGVDETSRLQRRRAYMPDLPAERFWITDHLQLKDKLPEIHETVIISWLSGMEPTSDGGTYTSRNLYRGMQRALDLGGLEGLSGVPCPAEGGHLWLRLR